MVSFWLIVYLFSNKWQTSLYILNKWHTYCNKIQHFLCLLYDSLIVDWRLIKADSVAQHLISFPTLVQIKNLWLALIKSFICNLHRPSHKEASNWSRVIYRDSQLNYSSDNLNSTRLHSLRQGWWLLCYTQLEWIKTNFQGKRCRFYIKNELYHSLFADVFDI